MASPPKLLACAGVGETEALQRLGGRGEFPFVVERGKLGVVRVGDRGGELTGWFIKGAVRTEWDQLGVLGNHLHDDLVAFASLGTPARRAN
jgi:hypothetical protein